MSNMLGATARWCGIFALLPVALTLTLIGMVLGYPATWATDMASWCVDRINDLRHPR